MESAEAHDRMFGLSGLESNAEVSLQELKKTSFWRNPDFTISVLLIVVVVAIFAKTVFLGCPISRVWYTAFWDVLTQEFNHGTPGAYDKALFFEHVPNFFHVAMSWRDGIVPLWNPYVGFGAPLVGNAQMHIFSPWRLVFALSPTMYFYNLLMVVNVAIIVLSTYGLARTLGLNRFASIFSVVTFAFCPYMLYDLEILSGTAHTLYPLVLFLFARLAVKPIAARAVLAGASAALFALTSNPECAFLGAVTGALLVALLLICKSAKGSRLAALYTSLRVVAIAAITAICLSAPTVLPVLEYLRNSECCKFDFHSHYLIGRCSWEALFYNVCNPGFREASLYTGIFTLPFVVLSAFTKGPQRITMILLFVLLGYSFLICSGPDQWIALERMTPLVFISKRHFIPVWLLMLSLLASFGFEVATSDLKVGLNRKTLALMIAAVTAVAAPWILKICGWNTSLADYYEGLPSMVLNQGASKLAIVLLLILGAVLAFKSFSHRVTQRIACCSILAMAAVDIGSIARSSLPVQPRYEYKTSAPVEFLKARNERIVQIGDHVITPNTNLVHRIRSIRHFDVMSASRSETFTKAANGEVYDPPANFGSGRLSKLVDLASIRYIIATDPIFFDEEDGGEKCAPAGVHFENVPEIVLDSASCKYIPARKSTYGRLNWTVAKGAEKRYFYTVVLSDEDGNPYWFSARKRLRTVFEEFQQIPYAGSKRTTDLAAIVPSSIKPGTQLVIGLQVTDGETNEFVKAKTGGGVDTLGTMLVLKKFRLEGPQAHATGTDHKNHYQLVEEFPQMVRIYENKGALPQAYFVKEIKKVNSEAEAMAAIKDPSFDMRKEAVIEGDATLDAPVNSGQEAWSEYKVIRPTPNQVTVEISDAAGLKSPGWLVLTDQYYPGWHAYADGKEAPIVRANYLFRAVPIQKGVRKIEFRYEPQPFRYGIILALGYLAALAAIGLKNRLSGKKNPKTGNAEQTAASEEAIAVNASTTSASN